MRHRIQFLSAVALSICLCSCAAFAPPSGYETHPEARNTVEKVGEAIRGAGAVADASTPWGAILALAGTAITAAGGWYRLKKGERDHDFNEQGIEAVRQKGNALETRILNLEIDLGKHAVKNPPGSPLTAPAQKI